MVIGGGKIGGGPKGPQDVAQTPAETQAQAKGTEKAAGGAKDGFESARPAQKATEGRGPGLAEQSPATDVLRLARDNPAAARQLVSTMQGQASANRSKIADELAAARNVASQLASEKFSRKKSREKWRELRKHREKLAQQKMRLHLGEGKIALLQQLAGKLGDPRLGEELDRLLQHHKRFKTVWGRRYHLLSIADHLYGADEDAPEHLRGVVRTRVRGPGDREAVGDALHDVSPRRVIAELIARTLDGSLRDKTEEDNEEERALHEEYDSSLQGWARLRSVMFDSLSSDPFGDDEDGEA